jgi:hypothetical protein
MSSNETNHAGKVFVSPNKISKKYHRISPILKMEEQERVEYIIITTGRYLYSIHQEERNLGQEGRKRGRKPAMTECSHQKRKKTCKDRQATSKPITQTVKSF